MVEGAALEMRYTAYTRIMSSNLILSAKKKRTIVLSRCCNRFSRLSSKLTLLVPLPAPTVLNLTR